MGFVGTSNFDKKLIFYMLIYIQKPSANELFVPQSGK
jgi:hypothetical protein